MSLSEPMIRVFRDFGSCSRLGAGSVLPDLFRTAPAEAEAE